MNHSFYIATGFERKKAHNLVRDGLVAKGHRLTYDWTSGTQDDRSFESLCALGTRELQGVRDCDVLMVLLPGARGTHAELGAGLALGKRIILQAHPRDRDLFATGSTTSPFYWPGRTIRVVCDLKRLVEHFDRLVATPHVDLSWVDTL